MLVLLVALQEVAGPPAPRPLRAPVELPRRCEPGQAGEITVCGKRDDAYRLKPLPDRFTPERAPPRAEMRVFGDSKLSLEAEQGADAQGGTINRAMVRLKIPLGGKRR